MIDNPGLDYDRGAREYNLTVSVTDGHFTVNDVFTVHVTDVNEAPVFHNLSRAVDVDENFVGRLFVVSTSDEDVGDTLSVDMVATPSSGALQFVPQSGRWVWISPMGTSYKLIILILICFHTFHCLMTIVLCLLIICVDVQKVIWDNIKFECNSGHIIKVLHNRRPIISNNNKLYLCEGNTFKLRYHLNNIY